MVTDTAGGAPLAGVLVTCTCQGGTDTTDGTGNFSFTNIAAGTYSITFSETGYVTDTINNVVVTSGNQANGSAALTEDGGIVGTVTNANTTAPIPGATVTCSTSPITTAVTDSLGSYAFANVIPGTYTVSVSVTGYVGGSNNGVVVNAGNPSTNQSFSLTPIATSLSVARNFEAATSGMTRSAHADRNRQSDGCRRPFGRRGSKPNKPGVHTRHRRNKLVRDQYLAYHAAPGPRCTEGASR